MPSTAVEEAGGPRPGSIRFPDILAAGLLLTLAFAGAFGLYRFFDDWNYAEAAAHAVRTGAVAAYVWFPMGQHWSPAWFSFSVLNFWLVGWESDLLIRALCLALAAGGLILFAWFGRISGLRSGSIWVGMGVLALHHLNGVAYYSFDCYSQMAVDLVTWTVLVLLVRSAEASRAGGSALSLMWAVGLFAPALLVKEQALAAPAGFLLATAWSSFDPGISRLWRRQAWMAGAGMLAISVVFALVRWRMGLVLDEDGPYQFCLSCVPGNVGLIVGALCLPSRSLEVYLAMSGVGWDWVVLTTAAVSTAAVVLLMAVGVERWAAAPAIRRRVWLFVGLLLSSCVPVAVLSHIGVLHAHTAVFWFAWLAAIAAEGWSDALAGTAARARVAAGTLAVLYVLALGTGLRLDLYDMRASGERSRAWLARFAEAFHRIPSPSIVAIRGLIEIKGDRDYSIIRLTTPGYLLGNGVAALSFIVAPGVRVVEEEELTAVLIDEQDRGRVLPVYLADLRLGQIDIRPVSVP